MQLAYSATAVLTVLLILAVWRVRVSGCGFQAWFLHAVARAYTRYVFRLKAIHPRTTPEHTSAIIIANHTSPADPMLIWADHCRDFKGPTIRLPGFMTAKEYCEFGGIVGWICGVMESIPVERTGKDMGPAREALRRLKKNQLVGVFPEGKINHVSPDVQLIPGDTGAAWLALKSQAPVIPIYIKNAPRGKSMVHSFLVQTRSTLHYGQPIDLSRWYGQRLTQQVLREVTDEMMHQLAKLGGVKPAPPTVEEQLVESSVPPAASVNALDEVVAEGERGTSVA